MTPDGAIWRPFQIRPDPRGVSRALVRRSVVRLAPAGGHRADPDRVRRGRPGYRRGPGRTRAALSHDGAVRVARGVARDRGRSRSGTWLAGRPADRRLVRGRAPAAV